jgi:hypothetical protein
VYRSSRHVFFGLAVALATPGLSSAEKLPVFKLAEPHADAEQARALLARMTPQTDKASNDVKAVERAGAVGFRAGNTSVEIETASGGIFAANLDQLWNPRLAPRLPSRQAAREQADAFLSENGLLPKDEGYVRLSEPMFAETGAAPDAPGGKKTSLDIQINYQVKIAVDGRLLPVVGGGGDFKVAVGEGSVIGYSGTWRPIEGVAAEVEVMSQAAAEAQYRASVKSIRLDKVESFLAYYAAPSFEAQSHLAPVWVVRAVGQLDGNVIPMRQAIIAASEFGPKFPSLPLQPRTPRTRNVFDDAIYEGGTSWIGPSQGLGGSPANAQGFVNGLAAAGWTIRFNWGETNAWESDWNANDDFYADEVDWVFYTGHANSDGWVLNPPADTFLHFTEVGGWPGVPDDHYGSRDLEWMVIAACGPHQSNHFTTGVGSAFDRWRGIFDGLHVQMGYGAVTFDNTTEGSRVTELSRAGWTLVDAWFRTAWEIQPATNGFGAPNGPTIFVTAMYAHYGDHATRYDTMWGAGFVAADPIGPAQQRYMMWSGT